MSLSQILSKSSTLAAFALLIGLPLSPQESPHSSYSAQPLRQVNYVGAFGPASSWDFVRWHNGYLITRRHDASPSRSVVALYDREDNFLREAVVWPPGARESTTSDATVTKSGLLLLSAGAITDDGSIANYIAAIDSSGKTTNMIRTNPFVPLLLCAADDNDTVWAWGWDREGEKTKSYPMLRQYSFTKGLQKSLVDRAGLPKDFVMAKTLVGTGLRCNANWVGLYVDQSEEWSEYNTATGSLVRWPLPKLASGILVTGYALSEDGEFFASMGDQSGERPTAGIFHLERTPSGETHWNLVKNTVVAGRKHPPYMELLDISGGEMVYVSNPASATLQWMRLAPAIAEGNSSPPPQK